VTVASQNDASRSGLSGRALPSRGCRRAMCSWAASQPLQHHQQQHHQKQRLGQLPRLLLTVLLQAVLLQAVLPPAVLLSRRLLRTSAHQSLRPSRGGLRLPSQLRRWAPVVRVAARVVASGLGTAVAVTRVPHLLQSRCHRSWSLFRASASHWVMTSRMSLRPLSVTSRWMPFSIQLPLRRSMLRWLLVHE